MREVWFERTTTAVLRDAFRVETQVPNADIGERAPANGTSQLPEWLYGAKNRPTAFSRYDLRKTTHGASI